MTNPVVRCKVQMARPGYQSHFWPSELWAHEPVSSPQVPFSHLQNSKKGDGKPLSAVGRNGRPSFGDRIKVCFTFAAPIYLSMPPNSDTSPRASSRATPPVKCLTNSALSLSPSPKPLNSTVFPLRTCATARAFCWRFGWRAAPGTAWQPCHLSLLGLLF